MNIARRFKGSFSERMSLIATAMSSAEMVPVFATYWPRSTVAKPLVAPVGFASLSAGRTGAFGFEPTAETGAVLAVSSGASAGCPSGLIAQPKPNVAAALAIQMAMIEALLFIVVGALTSFLALAGTRGKASGTNPHRFGTGLVGT